MDWNYSRDDAPREVKKGIQRCCILNVEESVSKKSGLPMIVITVQPSGSKAKVNYYIVHNDHFNRNMTEFFDAFPTIKEGNMNFLEWIGAVGAADFGTDDKGYLRVRWFVKPEKAANLPPYEGNKPEQQTVTTIGDDMDAVVDESGLPF